MATWKLVYRDGVKQRVHEISRYISYELGDFNGAQMVVQRLEETILKILQSPHRYRLHPERLLEEQGVRVAVCGSYHILFRLIEAENVIRILDVLHRYQDTSAMTVD